MSIRNTAIGVATGLALYRLYDKVLRDDGSFIFAAQSSDAIEGLATALEGLGPRRQFRVDGEYVHRGMFSNGMIVNFTTGLQLREGVMLDDIPSGIALVSRYPRQSAEHLWSKLVENNHFGDPEVYHDFDPDTERGKMSLVYIPGAFKGTVVVFRRHKFRMGEGRPPKWERPLRPRTTRSPHNIDPMWR